MDLDSITFIIAYNHREETSEEIVSTAAKNFISTILQKTEAEYYLGFYQVSGHMNYRNEVVPAYKRNRPASPEFILQWKDVIHKAFSSFDGVVGLTVIESDDAMSIIHYTYNESYDIVYAHIDKDLNCIPGNHYNYSKNIAYWVSSQEAYVFAKTQVLTGDSNDGVPGVPGVGAAKAKPYVEKYESVVEAFKMAAKDKKVRKWITLFYETYSCINLLKNLEELKKYTKREEVDIFKITPTFVESSALQVLEDWD